MEGKGKSLSNLALKSSGSEMAKRAYAELKAQDGIEDRLKTLERKGGDFSVSHIGGIFVESKSLSMISDTDAVNIDGSKYSTERLIFTPRRGLPDSEIKYAATGFTGSIYEDRYSKAEVIDTSTGESKDASKVLIGGSLASLMVMNPSGNNATSDIYFDYGKGGSLGSLKLELTSEKIDQNDIKDAFLRGYNSGGVEKGVMQLLEMAKENFDNYVCIVYPDMRLRSSESLVNSEGFSVSRENASTVDLPTYIIFYSQHTSFITMLSKATPRESLRNGVFKIRKSEIKNVSNIRPYIDPPKDDTVEALYR